MATVTHERFRANAIPAPIDPDVKVPDAVKRAAAAAEKAQREAYNLPDPNAPPQDPPAPTPSDTITIAPPAPPVAPDGVTTTPAETPAAVPETGTPDSWENRFKSEQGRNRKLKELLDGAHTRITALETMLADQRSAPPTPTPAPAPVPVASLITDKEKEEFGPEMLSIMERIAQQTAAPLLQQIDTLKSASESLASRLNGTTQQITKSGRELMMQTLDQQLPNWREINVLSEFKTWLALPDPMFGVIRNKRLQEAWEQNDTPSVLSFFRGFVSELATVAPVEPTPPTPPALQPDTSALTALAAPGRARTPASTAPPAEKQIITTADINAFYAAKRRGDYIGREELFNQLEQELFLAQREGRVRAS